MNASDKETKESTRFQLAKKESKRRKVHFLIASSWLHIQVYPITRVVSRIARWFAEPLHSTGSHCIFSFG